jgi:hypothetical protein
MAEALDFGTLLYCADFQAAFKLSRGGSCKGVKSDGMTNAVSNDQRKLDLSKKASASPTEETRPDGVPPRLLRDWGIRSTGWRHG